MGVLKRAFAKRMAGEKPSPPAAAGAAIGAGAVIAVTVYRVLRSG